MKEMHRARDEERLGSSHASVRAAFSPNLHVVPNSEALISTFKRLVLIFFILFSYRTFRENMRAEGTSEVAQPTSSLCKIKD